jgi:NitT/TauT family transport system substrate-binding protein
MNKTLKTILGLGAVILVIALISTFAFNNNSNSNPTPVAKLETTKVKIGYLATNNSIPLYVAAEKNYFKEAGLEAELVKFEAPNLFVDAMVGGQIDFSAPSLATGIMSIVENKTPGKFSIFGANNTDANNPADVIIVPNDSTANTFADLKGKTCATLPGPQFKVVFTKLAKDAGLKAAVSGTEGDIYYKELPVSEFVTALASKAVDCIVGLEPAGTVAVTKGVGKVLSNSPYSAAFGGKWYGGIAVVNNEFKTKNPVTTSKIIQAIDKATAEIQANPILARQFLPKYLGVPEAVATNMKVPAFRSSTDLNESDYVGMDNFLSEFQAQGVYPTKPDFRKLKYVK